METNESIRVVKQMFVALNEGNMTAVLNLFADEVEFEIPGPRDVPFVGRRHGRGEVAECFAQISKSALYENFEAREFLGSGERVVVIGHETLRSKETGRAFHNEWVMVFTVKRGKIVTFRNYWDTAAGQAAFKPPAETP